MRLNNSSRARERGFTLFEVILASAIFVLLAGAIYLVVSTAVSSSVELGEVQMDARKNDAFGEFMRDGFRNLSAETGIKLRSRVLPGNRHAIDLVMDHAPGAFTIGVLGARGDRIVLSLLPNEDGSQRLMITRIGDGLTESEMDQALTEALWLPLLDRVTNLRWRFWDQNLDRFVETWDRGVVHPELIELTYSLPDQAPATLTCSLPRLSASGASWVSQ